MGDPLKTAQTFIDWQNASPEQKAIALHRVKRAAELGAVYIGLLEANNALQATTDQKDRVNLTDPTKSDWMRFKWNGRTLDPTGNMLGPLKFMAQMTKIFVGEQPKAYGPVGPPVSRIEAAAREAEFYARGKLAPQWGIAVDFLDRRDAMGRPMPFSSENGTESKPKYTWGEWAWSHAPLPVAGAAREYYDTLREKGVGAGQAEAVLNAFKALPIEMTGARVGHSPKTGEEHKTGKRPPISEAEKIRRSLSPKRLVPAH